MGLGNRGLGAGIGKVFGHMHGCDGGLPRLEFAFSEVFRSACLLVGCTYVSR
jgi:hypothetical protein